MMTKLMVEEPKAQIKSRWSRERTQASEAMMEQQRRSLEVEPGYWRAEVEMGRLRAEAEPAGGWS